MGSHAAHLLLRSGVGRLRLIDFDQVSLSSLNRHALATRADVGMPKATCLKVGTWVLLFHLISGASHVAAKNSPPLYIGPAVSLQEHFRQLVPEAEVDARVAMYTAEAEQELLSGDPDFVIDAIDNIDTKVLLLVACKRRDIPVLCVAGAGETLQRPCMRAIGMHPLLCKMILLVPWILQLHA